MYYTTNYYIILVHHLKTKHSEQYVEFEKALEIGEQDKGKGKAVPQQLSLPKDCE